MLSEAIHALQRLLATDPCVSASRANCTDFQRQPGEAQGQAAFGIFFKVLKVPSMPLADRCPSLSTSMALKYLCSQKAKLLGGGRGRAQGVIDFGEETAEHDSSRRPR